jgi:hypothetical protein
MKQNIDPPNFERWQKETLVKFAHECYAALVAQQQACEQLRLDLKDAMKLARIQNMKDNAA